MQSDNWYYITWNSPKNMKIWKVRNERKLLSKINDSIYFNNFIYWLISYIIVQI